MIKKYLIGLATGLIILGSAAVTDATYIDRVVREENGSIPIFSVYDNMGTVILPETLLSQVTDQSFEHWIEDFYGTGLSLELWNYTHRPWGYEVIDVFCISGPIEAGDWMVSNYIVSDLPLTVGEVVSTAISHANRILSDTPPPNWPNPTNPIPEPATIVLFGIGVAGLAAIRLKQKQ